MSQSENAITVTIPGDLADWLQQEADRSTRTPSQFVIHVLTNRKQTGERHKQATAERKARRETLFGNASRLLAATPQAA